MQGAASGTQLSLELNYGSGILPGLEMHRLAPTPEALGQLEGF